MMRQTVRSEGGFTVPELMVAMTLSAMIMAGIFLAHKAGQDAYLFGSARIEVQQNARVAVNRMIEEIRRAGFDPTVSGNFGIQQATATTFSFRGDFGDSNEVGKGDGVVQATETIIYSLSGTTLRRDAGAGAQPLVEGVQALTFSYLDKDGNATAHLGLIRTVVMTVETKSEENPGSYSPGNQRVKAVNRVRLRNLS